MVENRQTPGSPEAAPADRLAQKKTEALEALLGEAVHFVQKDNEINDLLAQLLRAVVEEVKKNPAAALSGKGNLDVLVRNLKSEGDIGGSDIVGAGTVDDVIQIMKEILEIMKEEKPFFMEIIKLIFCGCK